MDDVRSSSEAVTYHTGKTARKPLVSHHMRARIRHAAFTQAPVWLTQGRISRVRADRGLTVTQRSLVLPDLPDALDGLKITHLSDLHIGQLTTIAHLPQIIETAKQCEGDLIAVTGDFVDLSLNVLDDVIDALARLEAPLGVYMVPGNHDYLSDGPEFVRRFRGAKLKLMLNEAVNVARDGKTISVAGIDYADKPHQLARMVHRTIRVTRSSTKSDLSLLLAHHPDAFDQAAKQGVDLTLSGHTHGGQFVLSNKRGKKGSIGLGSLAFRYPRGLYQRGNSYLYVNSGVGSWFPLRVKCPAEVACLTLRSRAQDLNESSHP